MKKLLVCSLALVLCACSPSAPEPKPIRAEDVNSFITLYIAVSNARDAGKAMSMIQRAPDVVSITGAKVTRGWDAIREATERTMRQPNPTNIELGTMEVWVLGPDTAVASGAMRIAGPPIKIGEREVTALGGAFTILVKRTPEGLRITHEHFSFRPL